MSPDGQQDLKQAAEDVRGLPRHPLIRGAEGFSTADLRPQGEHLVGP